MRPFVVAAALFLVGGIAGTARRAVAESGTEVGPPAPSSATSAATSPDTSPDKSPVTSKVTPGRKLPFMGDLAREHGVELPLPLGAGVVYYYIGRDIEVSEVRVGRNGAAPEAVPEFVDLGSTSSVDNFNVKFDVWLLPFLNVYAIAGTVANDSQTTVELTLPPLTAGGSPRTRSLTVPTAIDGTVGGLGTTVAGGYGSFFAALDFNVVRADLGFDDDLKAVVSSLRAGWHGKAGGKPLRAWANATYWDTFATVTGSVADPDGGTLSFEVDQGPKYPWTYGLGMQYTPVRSLDVALDVGMDFHGGWYVAFVPVFRF